MFTDAVLVTGGAGFLGRFVCDKLREKGYGVAPIRKRQYDLTVRDEAEEMFMTFSPDVVVHLAATVGGIGANRENPGKFFYENMAMGMNVLEAARKHGGVKKLVLVGTTCSYPKHTPVPFSEDDLWDGYPEETNAPYGVAKRALIVMAQAYRAQYGLNTVCLLPANLYGPGDNFDLQSGHVIPALIRKYVEAKKSGAPEVILWGTGGVSREFLYVEDCADGIVKALEHYDGNDPVNLGANAEIYIRDLALLIQHLVGYEGRTVWDSSQPDGQPRRCLYTERAKYAFGFTATTGLEVGLQKTIKWFLEHR